MERTRAIPGMACVYSGESAFEATLFRDRLRSDGIPAQLRQNALVDTFAGLALDESQVEVWVPLSDQVRAEITVRHGLGLDKNGVGDTRTGGGDFGAGEGGFRAAGGAALSPEATRIQRCPQCNALWEPGFDTCWNCCQTRTFD